jgi:hypothetical protein
VVSESSAASPLSAVFISVNLNPAMVEEEEKKGS